MAMNMDLDQRKKILIVDDDPFMQSLYRKALEREGFSILTALDGLAAVEMLPTLVADLIVLDLMLPKVHGLKVLEAVRADRVHKNLPVLILSNGYLPDVAQKAMNAKATTGILKSECSPKKLVKIIRDIFNALAAQGDKAATGQGSWLTGLLRGKDQNSGQEAPGAKTAEATIVETATLSEVQSELMKSWPTDISLIREDCLKYVKTVGSQESEEYLKSVYRQLRLLSARVTMGEYIKVSQLCNALEAMLFEHGFNLKRSMSPSVVQTMVQAVDCIEHLFKSSNQPVIPNTRKTRVLLVDDDGVCNMVNDIALKRANFDTVCVADGVAALALLENNAFDLIFLDVNMPVLSGFEVCEKLRKLPRSKDTPVIFVTLYGDFQSRAQGVLSGSNGFIAKPISPLELIVKALVFLQRSNPNEKPTFVKPAPAASPVTAGSDKVNGAPAVPVEEASAEGRMKEWQVTRAAVDDKVKALTEALAQESKRREEAEQQAAANAKLQSKLEAAQAENQKAYEWLQRLMEESEKQSQNGDTSQAWKADGRTRALEAVRSFVEDKVKNLTKVLAVETEKSELAKQKAAAFANRRSELEAALAEVEQAKTNLLRDIEAAGNGEQRGKLEAALAENQKSQSALFQKLVEAQQEFQIHQQSQAFEQGQTGVPGQEPTGEPTDLAALKSELASAIGQIQTLTGLLAAEAERRTTAESKAAELAAGRTEVEQELAQRLQTQEQLRAELAESHLRLESQVQTHSAEVGNFTDRMKEFESAQAALAELKNQHTSVSSQVQTLTESLAAEAGRRTTAEARAAELAARRAELEQELTQRSQTQEQLRTALAEKEQRLEAQVQTHTIEFGQLAERTKEMETAQAELTELKRQHASVTTQVQSLTESLTAEASRRTTVEQTAAELVARRNELERELAERSQTHEQLHAQLAEQQQRLAAQVQAHNMELENLTARTKELEATQAELAELKRQHAEVTAQVKSLTDSLAAEAGRRTTAEQTAAELTGRRNDLEQELAQRSQTHEQLHAQLTEQQQRLEDQAQAQQVESDKLAGRTIELTAAQAVIAELKSQQAEVTAQVKSLTESLAAEAGRRATVEQTAAELTGRRNELEQELAQRSQTHEQLHAQLAEQQQRLAAQAEAYQTETGNLAARSRELEAAQAVLAALKSQHANVTAQVESLTRSLAAESERRTAAEQTARELAASRVELEQELNQRSKTHEELHTQLAGQQERFEAQAQAHRAESDNLAERTKELATAQGALEELKGRHAQVTTQVQSLTESLAVEAGRRTHVEEKAVELTVAHTKLEQELAQRTQAQELLRAEVAEQRRRYEAQVQAHTVETNNLAERTKELAKAQGTLTKLKSELAKVAAQVKSLTGSLAAESERRSVAEGKTSELLARRNELEQELALRSKNQEQLRAELAGQQQRLEAQVQAHAIETGNLAARTKELAAAQAALTELKGEQAKVTAQVASLTGSLATETGRRANAENTATELATHRAELEQELTRHAQTQEGLRTELAAKKQEAAAVAAELEDFRNRATASAVREKQMAGQMAESEQARTELGRQLSAASELAATRAATLQALEGELQQRRGELERLEARLEAELAQHRRLETKAEAIQAQLNDVSGQLARKTAAEQVWLGRESELQNRLRTQQDEMAKAVTNLAAREQEIKRSGEQLEEMRVAQSALCAKVEEITEQARKLTDSLVVEVDRRLASERTVAGLEARRTQLELELDGSSRAQAALRAELDAQLQSYQLETGRLAERTKELETAQAALAELKHQQASLAGQVQTLTELLATESGRHAAAEQTWTGRESEWQSRLNGLQDRIATSDAALTGREDEIKSAREKISELQVLQSALCAKVQALTGQAESTAKVIQEWQTKAARSEDATAKVQRKLAGLHYSILDASRLSARLQRERLQREHQNLAAMQQLLASLAETPLSLTQRGVLAELQHSTENLKGNRAGATRIEAFRVELPDLRDSHFGFAEVAEGAFRAVRAAAATAGVAAQVTAAGITTGRLIGFAEHIQQLIILLATAPFGMMPGINALDLRVELVPENSTFSKMTVRAGLSADNQAQALMAHISTVAASSATLQSGEFSEAEFGLAAGWQLAAAMGAQANVEVVSSHEVRLLVSMLIEMDRGPVPAEDPAERTARNGHENSHENGRDHGNGNGNGNGHGHAMQNGGRSASHHGQSGHDTDHSPDVERKGLQPAI